MYKLYSFLFIFFPFIIFSQADYSVARIPATLLANSNSVLVDELIEVDVSDAQKMIYTSRRVITILNKNGDGKADAVIFYDDGTKVKDAEVFVYDASGREIQHFRKKDFKDVSAVDGVSLYNDDRVLYLNYPRSTYPYTLVFNTKIESSSTGFVYGWSPTAGFASSTKKSTYRLVFDHANKPRYKTINFEGFDISVSENPNELVFTAENIPSIKYEDLSRPFEEIAPLAQFTLDKFYLKGVQGNAKNWNEFGSWMQSSLLSGVDELPIETIEMVKNLVKDETTNLGKARKIYDFLQGKVRYISVQIGIGGWRPMLASEVDKLSYGDCKALTNYTKALLNVVGVPSYYTILYAGNEAQNIAADFSSIQGDHVILGVPDGDEIIWLECTSQEKPFGFMGSFTDDRDVLIITPEGGKIVRTKEYTFEENLQENSGTIILDSDGGISSNFQVVSKGLQYEPKYMLEKETYSDLKIAYKKRWSYINGINVEDANLENDKINVIITEKLRIIVSNYVSTVGDDWLFCLNVFNQSQYVPPRIINRKQDLFIDTGFKDVDRFIIELPEGCTFETLPNNELIENKFGSYSVTFKAIAKDKIEYSRSLIIKKGSHPLEEYDNYRSFRRKIVKLDKTKILLTPNNL